MNMVRKRDLILMLKFVTIPKVAELAAPTEGEGIRLPTIAPRAIL